MCTEICYCFWRCPMLEVWWAYSWVYGGVLLLEPVQAKSKYSAYLPIPVAQNYLNGWHWDCITHQLPLHFHVYHISYLDLWLQYIHTTSFSHASVNWLASPSCKHLCQVYCICLSQCSVLHSLLLCLESNNLPSIHMPTIAHVRYKT